MSEAHGEIGRALNESNERWTRHVNERVDDLTEKHRMKIALLERHQAEADRAITTLLACVHQPNPQDLSRWDIAPGKHRDFCALIAALQRAREQGERHAKE